MCWAGENNGELRSMVILQNHSATELWFTEKSDLSSISWGMWWWPWQQLRRPWAGESSEFSAFSKILAISLVQHDHCWHAWTPEWCLLVISMLPKMCWWRGLVPNRSRIFYTSSLQKHVERKQDIYIMITGVLQARQAKGSSFFFFSHQILDVSTSQPCNLPGHADAPAAHRSTGNAPCSEVSRGHQPEGSKSGTFWESCFFSPAGNMIRWSEGFGIRLHMNFDENRM